MKRSLLKLLLVAVAVALASTVSATSVHLKGGGKHAEPYANDTGLALQVMGALAGVGYGDVYVHLDALADVTCTCCNQGGNEAPGQNPAPINVTGSQFIPEDEITKNGNLSFDVTTEDPENPMPGAPDCPNVNWTQEIQDLAFTSFTLTIEQGGMIVMTASCTIDPPTVNGAVPKADVSCGE